VSVALFGAGTARGKIEIHLPRAAEPAAPGKAAAPGLSKATPKAQREISVAQPGIEVKAPTSGTKIVAGENCRVQWASTGSIDRVNIWMEYIDRNGQVTVNQIPGIGNVLVANTGSRTIRIPENWTSEHGERWRIKIAGGGAEGRSEMLTITRAAAEEGQPSGSGLKRADPETGAGPGRIRVERPLLGDEWVADRDYRISWTATDVMGDVTVSLIHRRTGHEQTFPIATVPVTRGWTTYRVPRNLTASPDEFVVEVATPDNKVKAYQNITVYTQPLDLVCRVGEIANVHEWEHYVLWSNHDFYSEVNVAVMNQGVDGPARAELTLRIIKMPENVVIHTEQWEMANIHPRSWYNRPQPIRIKLFQAAVRAMNCHLTDLKEGYFMFEATVSSPNEPSFLNFNNTDRRNKRIR
jgi:hypothetical protein